MNAERASRVSRIYQAMVTIAGLGLWAAAAAVVLIPPVGEARLGLFAFVPLVVLVGLFPQHLRMPVGPTLTRERLTFTLADAVVLVVASWYGPAAAVFAAGIEGFTSSRRTVRKLPSNLFSSSIMSLSAAAGAVALGAVLSLAFHQPSSGGRPAILAAAVALLAASICQTLANSVLLATLLALRHGRRILGYWVEFLTGAAPMFLPTCTSATVLYFAFRLDALVMLVVLGPVLFTVYVFHRLYRVNIQRRITDMEKAHRETIEALAVAINAKDEVTHEHVLRVQIYASGVARLLGGTDEEIEALKAGALLHDIGKIAVPDYIINKPGKLTASEFEKMKLHTVAGAQILGRVEFPYPIVPVVRHHHERWDGKGYPDGLQGEAIPLTARILSVVDCFDAVREDRQYRKGMTREQALDLVVASSGTQYDPRVVGTFVAHLASFEIEIEASRQRPVPTFGIEPVEALSESARAVAPAAGLAEEAAPAEPAGGAPKVRADAGALFELARSVIAARDRGEALAAFTEGLAAFVPFDLCAVVLGHHDSGENVVAHASGPCAPLLRGRRTKAAEGVTGWVIANGAPFFNTDPKLDLPAPIAEGGGFRTLASVPLPAPDGAARGAVTIYSASFASYSQEQQQLLEEASKLLAAALTSLADSGPAPGGSALRDEAERPGVGHASAREPAAKVQ
jgi:putative nucleotidyltransferase with HDIG domain